ncbi:hypothetical protein D3C84_843360 [compost metagenome]
MIVARHRIRSLAIEAEKAQQAIFQRAMAVGCIGDGIRASPVERVQYRTLMVGCHQGGVEIGALTLLLRQRVFLVLENTMLHGVLNFGGQAAFAVKALDVGLPVWRAGDLSIKGIVMVATQYGFAVGSWHQRSSVRGL